MKNYLSYFIAIAVVLILIRCTKPSSPVVMTSAATNSGSYIGTWVGDSSGGPVGTKMSAYSPVGATDTFRLTSNTYNNIIRFNGKKFSTYGSLKTIGVDSLILTDADTSNTQPASHFYFKVSAYSLYMIQANHGTPNSQFLYHKAK